MGVGIWSRSTESTSACTLQELVRKQRPRKYRQGHNLSESSCPVCSSRVHPAKFGDLGVDARVPADWFKLSLHQPRTLA
eukprot:1161023-Pelagomonas_calceolata.AAC.5